MKERRKAFFQRVSASLIVPITFLPLAAILLAIGTQLGIKPVEEAGIALLRSWLPLFYGIGISIGFTDGDAMGALSVATGFMVMVSVAGAVSQDPTINLGVLGGVVAGSICTWLYNRVKRVRLPEYLALFSGKRMGPLASTVAGVLLGYGFGYAWPSIHAGIVGLGNWIYSSGGIGVLVYGGALRLLIPTGLHHILMQLVDTQLGGWVDPATGKLVAGEYLRFLAGDPQAGRLLSGFFLTLCFAPLGAAMAIAHEARPEQRRRVTGLMTTGALTAMLLGVTEPVEFAYIFASPVLLGLHVCLSALASLLGYVLNIHMGGYALPMLLFNWRVQQNAWLLLPLGLAWSALYYFSFRAVIRWTHPPILGQVPEEDEERPVAGSGEGAAYLEALGGAANIVSLEACMTRLRLVIEEPARLDEPRLLRLGAVRVLKSGHSIQVVVGARAGDLSAAIRAAAGKLTAATIAPATLEPAQETGTAAASCDWPVTLLSPLTGRVLPLAEVPDPVFGAGLVGDGVAVEVTGTQIVAPVDGNVTHIFPGGHALGLVTAGGLEILIHIGLDTAELKGEGFHLTAVEGEFVQAGMPMGHLEPERIAAGGKLLISPVLITNPDRAGRIRQLARTTVTAGEPLLQVDQSEDRASST
ncbi:MAG: glucose PTS transporter subunit IIA [Mycobacterium leprae]